jgi:hypothetical protein
MITFVNYHIKTIYMLMLRPSYIEFIYVLVLNPSSVSFWTCSVMVDSCILIIFILLSVLLPVATHGHFTSLNLNTSNRHRRHESIRRAWRCRLRLSGASAQVILDGI